MKVVVYAKPFLPRMGGLERNTLTLCLALTDLGHEVQLVTETTAENGADATYPFRVLRSTSLYDLFRVLRGASLFLINGNVSLRAIPCALLQGVPYGIIYHTYQGYRRQGQGLRTRFENRVRELAGHLAAANVFTNTHACNTSRLPDDTEHVILNPVDKRMAPLYEDQEEKTHERSFFLFAGRLIEGKGIFTLTDALSQLDGTIDLDVVVAGEGPDKDAMSRQSEEFATVSVELVGRLDEAELVSTYHRARALIVPSTTHKEGNPLVVAEAIYAGTPVIASDQPPMIESVGDAGMIVPQGDDRKLAAAIRQIATDEQHYQQLRQRAEQRAEQFSYERYLDKIEAVVASVREVTKT
jgi:glycosyltransferase involved in cell wall biosynthesis